MKSKKDNAMGHAYAKLLTERAMLLRSSLLLTPDIRAKIAADLDALGRIAEQYPNVFRDLK